MNTRTPCLPRMAYSAALPVSPLVAPRMFSCFGRARASSYSNRCPSSCMAMSLKASVGPLDRHSRWRPAPAASAARSAAPKTLGGVGGVAQRAQVGAGMSSMYSRRISKARSAYVRRAPARQGGVVDARVVRGQVPARRRAPGPRAGCRRSPEAGVQAAAGRTDSAWECRTSVQFFLADADGLREHGRAGPASGPWANPSCFSTVSWVRMMRSVWFSPSALSRCSTASIADVVHRPGCR
jgi:hypothetical protein